MRWILSVFAAIVLAGSVAEARVLPSADQAFSLIDGLERQPSGLLVRQLDDGGGAPHMNYSRDRLVAVVLALIPGFGLGHFWLNDMNGFITFLIVDLVLYSFNFGFSRRWDFGPIPWIIFVIARIWQVVDVLRISGGSGGDGGEVALALPSPLLRARDATWRAEEVDGRTDLPVAAFSF